jgi:thiol-disulfide isomerase/thioredoxin/Flp pilus assembly protein TadD
MSLAGRILLLAVLLGLLILACPRPVYSLQKPAPKQATKQNPEKLSPAEEESQALDKALRSAEGNPQALIRNLEAFLARFPKSPRRELILRTIYKQALQANDPAKAAVVGEKLLDLNPEDPGLLSSLVELLDRQGDTASRERALHYATKFVERAEKGAREPRPSDVSEEQWRETQALMRATAYLMRGKLYAKSGETDRAFADYQSSYAAYPTAQVAERLGNLAAKKNDLDRAVEYFATAFAFPEKNSDPVRREQVRRKLGSLYVARHQSEKGLGDLVLTRYDELMRSLAPRFKNPDAPNADARDPFDYVLQRADGSPLRLTDYRGRVVVMEFWATWCGPCRLEGKLLERVVERFRTEPAAVFLAVNVDEDREGVPAFLKEERWTVPVVFAQGLDRLLGVRALPTLMIFDRRGRVVYRQEGVDFSSFVETIEKKVREALHEPAPASAGSR